MIIRCVEGELLLGVVEAIEVSPAPKAILRSLSALSGQQTEKKSRSQEADGGGEAGFTLSFLPLCPAKAGLLVFRVQSIMSHWNEILVAAEALNKLGLWAQLLVLALGLGIVLVGRHLFRHTAGFAAATSFWLVAHTTMAQSFFPPEARTALALGIMVVGFYTFGLVLPVAGALMASGLIGVELGLRVGKTVGADLQVSVALGAFGLVILAGLFHTRMASLLPALAGSALITFSGFAFSKGLPSAPSAFSVPMVWLSIWFTLTVLAVAWDVLRDHWERLLRHRRVLAEEERARKLREAEDRRRYARYLS